MLNQPSNHTRVFAKTLIDFLINNDVIHFFISPGMRNSPLIWAAHYHPDALIYDGIDERAHAYRALGFTKATGKTACLICTSGTALANYFPTIIEAYKTGYNLLIISADRPPKLIKGNANQTIIQQNIYGVYSNYNLDHYCDNTQESFDRLRDHLPHVIKSLSLPGATHINLGFDEPLDHTENSINFLYEIDHLKIRLNETKPAPLLQNKLTKKPLFVVGDHNENVKDLNELVKIFPTSFYLDVTSGIKFNHNTKSIPSFDHPEVYQYFSDHPPTEIIHLGGRVVSKQYYKYLKENEDIKLTIVHNSHLEQDPAQRADIHIKSSIIDYLKSIVHNFEDQNNNYFKEFIEQKSALIEKGPLSYPSISKMAIESFKEGVNLFFGNSTFIRSFDYYASPKTDKHFNVYANRGASGIEGLVASAQGVSLNNTPTVLFIGDISLIHDLNSLINTHHYQTPLLIICANNSGGGIFDLLPISKDKELLEHITTEPKIDFKSLCEGAKIDYQLIESKNNYSEQIKHWNKSPKTCLWDIQFKREDNLYIYEKLRTLNL